MTSEQLHLEAMQLQELADYARENGFKEWEDYYRRCHNAKLQEALKAEFNYTGPEPITVLDGSES